MADGGVIAGDMRPEGYGDGCSRDIEFGDFKLKRGGSFAERVWPAVGAVDKNHVQGV